MVVIKKILKPIKRILEYWLIIAIVYFFKLLSVDLGRKIGVFGATLAYYLFYSERKKVFRHIKIAFPDYSKQQVEKLALRTFRHFGLAGADLLLIDKIVKNLDRYVSIDETSKKYLDQILEQDKGTVFISAHIGNWELLAIWLTMKGYPTSTVAKELYDPRVNRLIANHRKKYNIQVLLRGKEGKTTNMLRALKRPGIVGFLIDQSTKVPGVYVDFFGKPAYTPKGAAQLALKLKNPVIAGFCVLKPDKTYEFIVKKPFDLISSSDNVKSSSIGIDNGIDNDILKNTAMYTKAIEDIIKQYPEQWVWFHRRWKRIKFEV